MASTLYGVVGDRDVLGGLRHPTMHRMQPLDHDLGFCHVRVEATMDEPLAGLPDPLPRLTESVLGYAEVVSVQTPVIYIVAEDDRQAAVGWQDGELAFGPLRSAGATPRRRFGGRRSVGAIDTGLRWLGVPRARDRFSAVGLALLEQP